MGSKNRIANEILPIILKDRQPGQFYVEPFCGGLGTIDKVNGNRIAADNNFYLIEMWRGLQKNTPRPYDISKEMYDNARQDFRYKTNLHYSNFLIGWIGWMASFNGRFFDGGYSGATKTRNYVDEQIRNTEKQINLIKDIEFVHSDYDKLIIPPKSLIYCDIPYKGTKQYTTSKNFDYNKFFNWCGQMSLDGHTVFLSEYTAPFYFNLVWEKQITNAMHTTKTTKPIEKLFRL